MSDSSNDANFAESFGISSIESLNDQSEIIYNGSLNGTLRSLSNDFGLSNEIIRLLFAALTTIITLVCLTIFIAVCICICLNRRRNLKRQEQKDHLLLPEQSEKISEQQRFSFPNPISKSINITISSNSKQESEKHIISPSMGKLSPDVINGTTPIISYYYDNLDDIPFIDESRPPSFIDITRV